MELNKVGSEERSKRFTPRKVRNKNLTSSRVKGFLSKVPNVFSLFSATNGSQEAVKSSN